MYPPLYLLFKIIVPTIYYITNTYLDIRNISGKKNIFFSHYNYTHTNFYSDVFDIFIYIFVLIIIFIIISPKQPNN